MGGWVAPNLRPSTEHIPIVRAVIHPTQPERVVGLSLTARVHRPPFHRGGCASTRFDPTIRSTSLNLRAEA